MSLVEFYPPVAAAAVLFTVWLAVAYRFHKTEAPGRERFRYVAWLATLPIAIGGFGWLHGFDAPLAGALDKLMAALTGLAIGALGVFSVHIAFFAKADGPKDRITRYVYCVLFAAFVVGSLFVS